MVRYVHLPGSAVDTALLEDGKFLLVGERAYLIVASATRREAQQQASKAK